MISRPILRIDIARRAASGRAARRFAPIALAFAGALFLGACAGDKEKEVVPEQPVEQLYNDAMDKLVADDYDKAANLFDEIDRQHPYSVWATKGQLMSAFSHYRNSEYAEAAVTLDHFIELHPAHENIDYAYYLRALCYYERITDVSRDQQMTERAKDALEELVNRFPNSKYAADAKPKLILVRDQLAGKEMEIGRYYQVRGHYLAAINRFRTVVTKYQSTTHVPEALHRLTELYMAMGVMDAAQEYAAVLGYNYPGSQWYADSYDLLVNEGHVKPEMTAAATPTPRPTAATQPTAASPAPQPAARNHPASAAAGVQAAFPELPPATPPQGVATSPQAAAPPQGTATSPQGAAAPTGQPGPAQPAPANAPPPNQDAWGGALPPGASAPQSSPAAPGYAPPPNYSAQQAYPAPQSYYPPPTPMPPYPGY